MILSFSYSQDYNSLLEIRCPADWTISINGNVKDLQGDVRQFKFPLAKGEKLTVNILAWKEPDNLVLYNQNVEIIGGQKNIVETIKRESSKKKIPDFDIFNLKKKSQPSIINPTREKRSSIEIHNLNSVSSTLTSGICITT